MSEQSVEVVKRAYDIEWHEAEGMPYGGEYRGGEAVVQNVFGPISEDVEGFSLTPEEYMAAGDTVAVVVSYRGTQDGKAVRFRQFADAVKFADVVPAVDSVAG